MLTICKFEGEKKIFVVLSLKKLSLCLIFKVIHFKISHKICGLDCAVNNDNV